MSKSANLVSAFRLGLAALWLRAASAHSNAAWFFVALALLAALSDLADGYIARRAGSNGRFGQWLDVVADITFILTATVSEVWRGALPFYVPVLIAAAFAQYVADSTLIAGETAPIQSRIGHWGGVVNFALVIVLAFSRLIRWAGALIFAISPLLALFYVAGMTERALGYCALRRDSNRRRQSARAA